jgi:hypothetical protein
MISPLVEDGIWQPGGSSLVDPWDPEVFMVSGDFSIRFLRRSWLVT